MSVNLSSLPSVTFCEADAETVKTEVISAYEAAAGRTLAPGDPVRLFLLSIAAVIIQQRELIDWSAKQNLLAYATGDYLDHLGALLGVTRLPASAAVTTLKFTLSAAQRSAVTIPAGTRATPDGTLVWATDTALTISAGDTSGTVTATCTTAGDAGNGYTAGQIAQFVDPVAYVAEVANTSETTGGADTESDAALRERIRLAPESFSVAGSRGAYEYWAKSASSAIADVAVTSDEDAPGEVYIYPLLTGGELPSAEVLQLVADTCSADTVRPLTDHVFVKEPTAVEFQTELKYYIAEDDMSTVTVIQAAVEAAVAEYELWQRSKIGRDINPSYLIQKVMAAGALRVEVTGPAHTVLAENEVAQPSTAPVITYGGIEIG